ncbi:TPA: hypothetical protein ACXJRV_004894, partial [Serratia marcescens]
KVTAPQWQLPWNDMAVILWQEGGFAQYSAIYRHSAAPGAVSLINARFSGRLRFNVIKRRSRC